MKLTIDHNHLLVIEHPNIPQTKTYTYNVSGYTFTDYDKGIIVAHKKERKIINLKNLGDTMSVVYITKRWQLQKEQDDHSIYTACSIFEAFDEETGQTYHFLPKYPEKKIERVKSIFQKLGYEINIKKIGNTCIITLPAWSYQFPPKDIYSFLFGLVLLHGKLLIKNSELSGLKIHLPLFGQFLKYEDMLDTLQKQLAQEGVFVYASKQKTPEWILYQISTNDYELLEIFTKRYEPIENIHKITKREFTQEMKNTLITFLETHPDIPMEWKKEVIEAIQTWTIKLLTK